MKTKQFTSSFTKLAIMLVAVFLLSQSCVSAGSLFFSSGTDVAVPDGTGSYVHSPITVSGAPSGATVTRIDWFMSIHHNDGRDIDVDLNDHTRTTAFKADLWRGTFLSGGTDSGVNPVRQGTIISGSLIGLPVNQIWYLAAADVAAGDAGYIDAWNLTIYWADVTTYAITPNPATVNENAGTLTFTITRSGGTPAETIYVSTSPGEGFPNNSDYTGLLNQTVTFTSGQLTRTVTLTINNDSTTETSETFGFIAQRNSSDPASIYLAKSTFTIIDNDTPGMVLSVTPASPSIQPASAGSINLNVNNTGSGTMSYFATVTSGSSWLSITSGGSGGNSGTIAASYAVNPGAQRSGTIQVTAAGASGSPLTVTITQSGTGGLTVPITQDFIPVGRNNRPAYPLTANYITIHDTDNPDVGANAAMHAIYVKSDTAAAIPASWHFTVDDHEIYQHLPLNENGWHAGDGQNGTGNRQSIAIEICMNSDGNRAQAEENAAWLTAKLLTEVNLSLDQVKQHNNWSGKNCPSVLRGRTGGWDGFLARVAYYQGAALLPDLTIVEPVAISPTSVAPGGTIRVDWMETNKSTVASTLAHNTKVFLSTSAYGTTHLLGYYGPMDTLGGGAAQAYYANIVVPASIPAGDYYVTAFMDCDQQVSEGTGENNNIGSSTPTRLTVSPNNISVTIQSSPSGRSFTVDGTAYTSTHTFTWIAGSSHIIATTSTQSDGSGTQYLWSNWSDGGVISHTVVPTSSTTYTANFTTQYYLTMSAGVGGNVSPSSGWYNNGVVVGIGATPNSGYSFSSWTGGGSGAYSGSSSSTSVTMNGPITETASFIRATSPTISNPRLAGATFTLSVPTQVGFNYTLEYKSSFSDANWTAVQTRNGTGGTVTLTDTGATNSSRFYHVRVQ